MTKFKMEKCVPGVRWLIRDGIKVLQEYWDITTYQKNGIAIGKHGEWRDVPTEEA